MCCLLLFEPHSLLILVRRFLVVCCWLFAVVVHCVCLLAYVYYSLFVVDCHSLYVVRYWWFGYRWLLFVVCSSLFLRCWLLLLCLSNVVICVRSLLFVYGCLVFLCGIRFCCSPCVGGCALRVVC